MSRMHVALILSVAMLSSSFSNNPEGIVSRSSCVFLSSQVGLKIVRDDPDERMRKIGMLAYEGYKDEHGFAKYGFVSYSDHDKVLAPAIYDGYVVCKKSYEDGLIAVRKGTYLEDKVYWGFINFNGQEVIPCEYDIEMAGEYLDSDHMFDNGMVIMSKDGVYGAFDKSGNTAIPFEYEDFRPFKNGISTVCKNGLYAAINRKGEVTIPYRYTKLYYINNHRFVAAKDGKYGVINEQEEVLIPFEFKWISADWRRGWAYATLPDGTDVAIDSRGNLIDK